VKKVPMEVNAMPGLVLDESDKEESYGDVNIKRLHVSCKTDT